MKGFSSLTAVLFFLLLSATAHAQPSKKMLRKGQFREAEEWSKTELAKFQREGMFVNDRKKTQLGVLSRRVAPYYTLAIVEKTRGNFSAALDYFTKADSAYAVFYKEAGARKIQRTQDPFGKTRREIARNTIRQVEKSRINLILGNLEEAKTNLDDTYDFLKRTYLRNSYNNIIFLGYAEYFFQTARYDSSAVYSERYISELLNQPNIIDFSLKELGEAYTGLSKTYLKLEEPDKALKAAIKGEKYSRHRFSKFVHGKNYIGRAESANQVAEAFRHQYQYKKAFQWSRKAFRLYENKIRINTPEKLSLLATRGQLYWALSDHRRASQDFDELIRVYFDYIQNNFSYLAEGERSFFFRNNRFLVDLAKGYYHFLYFSEGQQESEVAKKLYAVNVNNKGVLLSASNKLMAAVYAQDDPTTLEQYNRLRFLKEDLARFAQSGNQAKAGAVAKEMNESEKALRNKLQILPDKFIELNDIARAVPDSLNFVDIFTCPEYTVESVGGRNAVVNREKGSYIYYIFRGNDDFVLVKNKHAASELDGRYYKAFLNAARFNIQEPDIYRAFFNPVESSLTRKQFLFSADGVYNLINPEILYDGNEYLFNRYEFFPIVSAKDLLHRHADVPIRDIALIGSPDFSTLKTLYTETFEELPGAEKEVLEIIRLVPSPVNLTSLLNADATEHSVKSLRSTSILHIATHGFFSSIEGVDPMHTSGLVLAVSDSETRSEEEDGYLTAYEASNLALQNTFLVVLSACETGQGKFEDSEGVWGLQRAFQVAGVRYVVMSLFKVDDDITALLMKEFYSHLFKGETVLTAFRKARSTVRKTSDNPLHWGAFIIKGI
jgi:CHAT domain-containing protein